MLPAALKVMYGRTLFKHLMRNLFLFLIWKRHAACSVKGDVWTDFIQRLDEEFVFVFNLKAA